MKLLYVCGTYAPNACSGSELSAHTLLCSLQKYHGVEVIVLSDDKYTGKPLRTIVYESIAIIGICHQHRYEQISKIVDSFNPDVILTQPWWHDVALTIAKSKGIVSILRCPDDVISPSLLTSEEARPVAVAVQTNSLKSRIEKIAPSIQIIKTAAFVNIDRVRSLQDSSERYSITMFNPIKPKGGFIFQRIARQMPKRTFTVIQGWNSLRKSNGEFDPNLFKRSIESQGGSYNGCLPEEPSFIGMSNVNVYPPKSNVREYYDITRILVFPALWREQYGRVILEAVCNGALAIVSGIDSMREHYSGIVEFVDDHKNPSAYIDKIRMFDEQPRYENTRLRNQRIALSRYSLKENVSSFYEQIKKHF